jgi:hypothetical protein
MNIFLAAFFNWWTEAGGAAVMEQLVAECEKTLGGHEQATQAFGVAAGEFGHALADFQSRVDENADDSGADPKDQ